MKKKKKVKKCYDIKDIIVLVTDKNSNITNSDEDLDHIVNKVNNISYEDIKSIKVGDLC